MLGVAACMASAQTGAATRHTEDWGTTADGKAVQRVTLENDRGMRLAYIEYGATLVEVSVPDRQGASRNVLLGLPDLAAYEQTKRRYGAIVGRYAGRIAGAHFVLDGRDVHLVAGADGATLHGGPHGYDKRVWQRRDFDDKTSLGSTFHLLSPGGDQNFPGRLDIEVTYRLYRDRNEFRIEYTARSDASTVLNLTNHGFFNLAGAGSRGLNTHRFQILADRYAVTDARHIPTGELVSIAGTPLDLRRSTDIAELLRRPSTLLGDPPGFDHGFVLTTARGEPVPAAVVDEITSGRRMEIFTTEPSIQFFSGNGFDGSEVGGEGIAYRAHDGFAIETQHLPDSPNHPQFPSTRLAPGQVFHSVTRYRFSVLHAGPVESAGPLQ